MDTKIITRIAFSLESLFKVISEFDRCSLRKDATTVFVDFIVNYG